MRIPSRFSLHILCLLLASLPASCSHPWTDKTADLALETGLLPAAAQGVRGIDLPPDPDAWSEWRNALSPKGQRGRSLTLTLLGRSSYQIVLPREPSAQDFAAADELRKWLGEIAGVAIPIVREGNAGPKAKAISIGRTRLLEASGLKELAVDLGEEGYGIATKGSTLFLWGGTRRGALNAVFALLEEDLGCRWYSNEAIRLPSHKKMLRFAPVVRTSVPPLRLRDPFYKVSFDPTWSLRNRTNAPMAKVEEKLGGRIDYAGGLFVHTFHELMPPAKYFAEHPEYYMLAPDGTRSAHQLCSTHPDVVRIVAERVRELLEANPDAEILSVSKMDGGGTCQCERCKALDEAEGTDMASLLFLVNKVAEATEKDHPKVVISTLAYLETIGVPKTMRPRPNVAIRVCTDNCAWSHPFTPARQSEKFAPVLREWSQVCKRMYIWDYIVNFSHYTAPMPNMDVVADNIRFFVENNAEGVMTQGAYQSPGAERDWMRSWVIAKLMWDPSRDVRELMRDFAWGYYGQAGEAMAAYDTLLRETGQTHRDTLAAPQGGIRYRMDAPFLSAGFLERATGLFARAEQMAESDAERYRVQEAMLPIQYVQLCRGPEFVGSTYPDLIDRFCASAARVGMTHISEGPADLDAKVANWRQEWEKALIQVAPKEETYIGSTQIEIKSIFDKAEIRYTLDGSAPGPQSKLYEGPFLLKESATLKAAVFGTGTASDGHSVAATFKRIEPRAAEKPSDALENGLEYVYYEGTWNALPEFSKVKPLSSGMLPTFALPPDARNERFAVQFSGFFEAPSDGMYTFYLTSDDGAILWIGDEKVVDNDGERAATEASGQIALAGGLHSIAVGYFQGVGEKALAVHWAGPDGEKKPVEEASLFRMP